MCVSNKLDPELKEAGEKLAVLTKQRNDAEAELEALSKDANLYKDFRISLIRIPKSKCPAENQQIPDVKKGLEELFLPEATPSIPIKRKETKS